MSSLSLGLRIGHRAAVVMLAAVVTVAGCAAGGAVGERTLPDVELTSPGGDTIGSASLVGTPMVINFWFSTCAPCAVELADFAEVHAEVGDSIRFVGVNPLDSPDRMQTFAAERGVGYELYSDLTGALQDRLGITSFPATLFVASDGSVVGLEGVLDDDALRAAIGDLVASDGDGTRLAPSDSATDSNDADTWNGIRRTPAPEVTADALPAVGGDNVSLRPERGRVTVVYFGYTSCPDVCPTTMADLSAALRILADSAALVDVVMLSVDPARDADRLAGYVTAFVPGGRAVVTDDVDLLAAVAEPFGASWDVRELDDGTIEVDHSPFLYAVGDDGRLAVTWPFGISSRHIAADVGRLLDSQRIPS